MSLLPARSKAAPRASASAVGSLVLHRARLLKRIRHAAHHRHLTVTNSARLANLLLGHAAQERDSCKPWADPLGRVLGLPSLGYPVGWSPGCRRDVGRYSGLPGRTRGAGAIRPKGTETAFPFSKRTESACFRETTVVYAEKVRSQFLSLRQINRGSVFSELSHSQLSPITAAISNSSFGLPRTEMVLLFSKRAVSLRTSGLHPFGTDREIRLF